MNKKVKIKWLKVFLVIAFSYLIIEFAFILFGIANSFYLWTKFTSFLVDETVIPINLIKAVAIILALSLSVSISLIFDWDQRKRKVGTVGVSVIFVFLYLLIHFTKRETFEDRCYTFTVYGYIEVENCKSASKLHPEYGTTIKKMTQEIAALINGKKNLQFLKVDLSKDLVFFDRIGNPQYWYYEDADGNIELFNGFGVHPQYGVELKVINKEVVSKVFSLLDEKRQKQDNEIYEEIREELKKYNR
ncbi:MAG: hypothetical protein AAFY76_00755 [Cyanobacteria bacterium J06649_11]